MLVLRKQLEKIKHYWLEDCDFYKVVHFGCYRGCSINFKQYTDLQLPSDSFDSFREGLYSSTITNGHRHQEILEFAFELGLKGRLYKIRQTENWDRWTGHKWRNNEYELNEKLRAIVSDASNISYFLTVYQVKN